VGALDLPVHALADVVEEAGAAGEGRVVAELGGEDAGDVGDLDRVGEDVLAVGGAEVKPAEELDEAGF